ncbi:MAG TPA: GNAT family N-acetyltransferase [Alphaproteobacteria bacterium]|nr:GNAT family N-acetyltransferase [Alphaproteobacteria bacterium]
MGFALVTPSLDRLPGYAAALRQGWSPDNTRPAAAGEQLARIEADPAAFVSSLDDLAARGEPVTLPDGSTVPRLPGYVRWMWDGEFCGFIGFRWQNGTEALPPHCLGHIGFSVVPWKRRCGYATAALRLLLPQAKQRGLAYVELTTDPDNCASQRVILANGGRLVERFTKAAAYGGTDSLRFRIELE